MRLWQHRNTAFILQLPKHCGALNSGKEGLASRGGFHLWQVKVFSTPGRGCWFFSIVINTQCSKTQFRTHADHATLFRGKNSRHYLPSSSQHSPCPRPAPYLQKAGKPLQFSQMRSKEVLSGRYGIRRAWQQWPCPCHSVSIQDHNYLAPLEVKLIKLSNTQICSHIFPEGSYSWGQSGEEWKLSKRMILWSLSYMLTCK